MSCFTPFPERGRDTVIALLYRPPPLSVITLTSPPLREDKFRSELQMCSPQVSEKQFTNN